MKPHHKDPCPCGSGKRYKHCHMAADSARRRNILIGALLVVVVGGAAAMYGPQWLAQQSAQRANRAAIDQARADSVARMANAGAAGTASPAFGTVTPGGATGPPVRDPNQLKLTPPNSGDLAPGENPGPWEYDVAKNRHYDPRAGHMHWHNGPPPANPDAPTPTPQVIATTANGQPVQVSTSNAQPANTPLKPGEHPTPWQYDAAKNQHFDPRPEHNHWHPGQPPADRGGTK